MHLEKDTRLSALARAESACLSLTALVLLHWATLGAVALLSPLLLCSSFSATDFVCYGLVIAICALVSLRAWNRTAAMADDRPELWLGQGMIEVDEVHEDAFSAERADLAALFGVLTPRWFVSVRNQLAISVSNPLRGVRPAAIRITSAMATVPFTLRQRRALLSHELAHVRLRSNRWEMLADCLNLFVCLGAAMLVVSLQVRIDFHPGFLLVAVPLAVLVTAYVGELLSKLISRIHENGADCMADIATGPGAIADCLVLMRKWQLDRGLKLERRHHGVFGLMCNLYSDLSSGHPHDLVRIHISRRKK